MQVGEGGVVSAVLPCDQKLCLASMGFSPGLRVAVLASGRVMRVKVAGSVIALNKDGLAAFVEIDQQSELDPQT